MDRGDNGKGRRDVLALRKPSNRPEKGLIPEHLDTIAGTWGALYDTGDLTYLNLVHLLGYDGTDPDDLTRGEMEGRKQAMMAVGALKRYTRLRKRQAAQLWHDLGHSRHP